ncbi:hypothetical protein FCK90_08700 [Kocuria coralli]|uniref:Uncharacterized protein n=1 Tax=Kocuria coralli TaxID=1461025 RepID=A0A5J5KYK9_9MICC|nr:hypothetical protein [Kocuria coralli]KAA9393995.1 hypothetical protein FCK90_08700 [Kocuria coralli]
MSSEHDHDPRPPDAAEQTPEPESARMAPESVEKTEALDVVRAARASHRRGAGWQSPAAAEARRARGVEWVRPTDLIARHGAALAGRGIDFEIELARRTRTPITTSTRHLGDRAHRLPPLSAFGRSTAQAAPSRRVGMS